MSNPKRGDFTGRTNQKLIRDREADIVRRNSEMAMVNAVEVERKENEVIDFTREPEPAPVEGPIDLTAEAIDVSESDETIDRIIAEAGEAPPAGEVDGLTDMTNVTPSAAPAPVAPVIAERASLEVRARFDLPMVTIGTNRHYDLEEGRRYLLPANAARHLAERELVDILS